MVCTSLGGGQRAHGLDHNPNHVCGNIREQIAADGGHSHGRATSGGAFMPSCIALTKIIAETAECPAIERATWLHLSHGPFAPATHRDAPCHRVCDRRCGPVAGRKPTPSLPRGRVPTASRGPSKAGTSRTARSHPRRIGCIAGRSSPRASRCVRHGHRKSSVVTARPRALRFARRRWCSVHQDIVRRRCARQ